MKNKYCFFTNDVECTSIVNNNLSKKTSEKVLKRGMPLLLELYKKYDIKTTFFFTSDIAEAYPEIVRMILRFGHEVGSHGTTHQIDKAFDQLPLDAQIYNLDKSKKLLEDISGEKVISFRAPALRVSKFTPVALEKTGFLIDSSIASQRFDMFLSYGSIKKFHWLIAPRFPYKTKKNNLARKGNSTITEIPISAFLLPYIGTTLRIFPKTTSLLGKILRFENNLSYKPINFLTHPIEFIEEEQDLKKIHRRSKSFINYILADLVRHKLKIRNLGQNAVTLYEKEIKYFKKRGYKFIPLKEYLEKEM